MAKTITGTPITYGSIDRSSNNSTGVLAIEIIDDSTGSGVTKFRGEMYASEVRVSYEADTNQSTDMLGEVISHCTYNQRKILNITGVVLANMTGNSVPTGATNLTDKANQMFSAPFSAGMRINVNLPEWLEVNSEQNPPVTENNLSFNNGGFGNYTITNAEKTRSSGNYAEWTISAIEYLSVAHGGNDTTAD